MLATNRYMIDDIVKYCDEWTLLNSILLNRVWMKSVERLIENWVIDAKPGYTNLANAFAKHSKPITIEHIIAKDIMFCSETGSQEFKVWKILSMILTASTFDDMYPASVFIIDTLFSDNHEQSECKQFALDRFLTQSCDRKNQACVDLFLKKGAKHCYGRPKTDFDIQCFCGRR